MANQPKKYKKFLVGAASAALVATAVAPVASAAEYNDTKGNTHELAIDELSKAGIISGYPDGSFKPGNTLTRSDVVKLMGKWLVSLGHDIPTDYKTNLRFTDLTTNSNAELLQYAALVADKGVFQGSDGKLNPSGNITRENMALVLVRAYDAIHGTDLVKAVKAEDFKRDVTDLATAKEEARAYIDVLDFYDITDPRAPKFNPKNTTTRGQFASFLHRTANIEEGAFDLKISNVSALNDTNQFLQIDFSKAVTSLAPSDINIKDAKSGAAYGVKEVKLAANGLSAQVELFQAKENENVLQYLTDYAISVSANGELLTFTFNRPHFFENRVVAIDVKNNKFTINTPDGRNLVLEVPSTFENFDYQALLGEDVRVWYDEKNRLVNFVVDESTALYDAIEIKATDEIKLLSTGKEYDVSDDIFSKATTTKAFKFYVDGKEVSTVNGEIPKEYKGKKYNYSKVGFDDSGDAIYVSVYNLANFLVVDKVEGNEIVGVRGEGTGGSFNAKDATIIKEGKAIQRADVKEGDVLFFNKSANNDDGFAEVLNSTVAGKIQTVFDDAVRVDGKTYKFKSNIDINKFDVDYDNAVFINDDNETEYVSYDEAEELQAAGEVTLYTDRAGHVVYIGGDTANVERNTLISILTADIAGETQFNRDRIEVEAVYSTGEERLFDLGLKDLKSIIVDGKTYDIDNDAKTKYTAKLVNNAKAIQITNNANKNVVATIQLTGTKGDVVKLHLDKDRTRLDKLEFYTTKSDTLTNVGLEKGDGYVGGKKLNNKTVVFDAKKFTNNASDIKTTTWGEYQGGKIKDVTIAYDKDNEVLGLVINDTESDADTLEEAVIVDVLRNTDQEVVEVTVFISGEKKTIKVDEVVSDIKIGEVAVLVFDDKNDKLVEGIYSTREFASFNKLGAGYAFKGDVASNGVDVGKREVTINGVAYKLANDGLVIDANTQTDIKTKSLTDLRGKTNVVAILDEKDSNFVKFFVYGGSTANVPDAPGEGEKPVAPTLEAKTIADQEITVGGTPLTFTADALATSNKELALTLGEIKTSDAAVATAVETDGKLVITAVAEGTTTVDVEVTDGTLTATATIKVTVTEEDEEVIGTKLSDLGVELEAWEVQDNTDTDSWGIVLVHDKLPAELQGGTSYTITIDGSVYELKKNRFNPNVFGAQVNSLKHTNAQVKEGIVTKN